MKKYWIMGKTYPQKEYLKKKGAKWDKQKRCWYIEVNDKQDEAYVDLGTLFKLREAE